MHIKDRDQFAYHWDLPKILKIITNLQSEVKDFYKYYDESERFKMKYQADFAANNMRVRIIKMLEECCDITHERGKDGA